MDLEQTAIERLKLASDMSLRIYKQPLIVTTSGGKDSSVCVELARRAGIPFEVMHNHTTADAPETVYFVRSEFKRLEDGGVKCNITYPVYKGKRTSMWALIRQKLVPPTRTARYCCEVLKERGNEKRFIVTGVRWDESKKRENTRGVLEIPHRKENKRIILENDNDEKRQLFETCQLKAKRVVNPIIDWTGRDVWDYILSEKIPYNPLYKEGFGRVGCILCPMAGKCVRQKELARWPKYEKLYVMAFEQMLKERKKAGKIIDQTIGTTAEEVFHWWMEDGVLPGQIGFDDLESEVEDYE